MVKAELIEQDPNIRKLMMEAAGLADKPHHKQMRKITECRVRIWQYEPKPQVHWGYDNISRCSFTGAGHTKLFNTIKDNVQADYIQAHVRDTSIKSYRTEDAGWQVLVVRYIGAVKGIYVVADGKHWGYLQQPVHKWDKPLRSPQQTKSGSYYWDYKINNMEEGYA